MRTAFIEALFDVAQQNERVMLVVADLGFGVVTNFSKAMPTQFLNVGVAEQNMIGLATGLALSGRIVFAYSIANFPVLRPLEQVRNDVCYHNANVKIVSVGGGLSYGSLGPSHHASEDIAVMRSLPNLMVVAPGDPIEAQLATKALAQVDGPAYLRLGRAGEPSVYNATPQFRLGEAITICEGSDITLIASGSMLYNTRLVADELIAQGISTRVLSMPTIKPLDVKAVLEAALETDAIITLEEHSITGGLGSAVAEVLMESNVRPRCFKRIGLPDKFTSIVGTQDYLREQYGLDPASILGTIRALLTQPRCR